MTLANHLKELHQGYLPYRNDTVPFPAESVVVWYYAYALQAAEGITGDVLEMGVEHGGTAFLAATAINPGEDLVLVDTRKSDKFARMEATLPEDRRAQIDFRECRTSAPTLEDIEARKFRFVHIDAGHAREDVVYDFERFAKCLADDGLLCFDDVFEVRWPGVTEAVMQAVPGSGIEPVLFANRKLYLAHSAAAPRYRDLFASNLDALSTFGTPRVWTEPFLGAPTVLMKMGIDGAVMRDIDAARANAAKLHAG